MILVFILIYIIGVFLVGCFLLGVLFCGFAGVFFLFGVCLELYICVFEFLVALLMVDVGVCFVVSVF